MDKGLKEAYSETKTVLSFCVDKVTPVIYRTQGYMLFECRKKYQCSSVSLFVRNKMRVFGKLVSFHNWIQIDSFNRLIFN